MEKINEIISSNEYFKEELPSGLKIEFRPWKVKEEKNLLLKIDMTKDENEIKEYIIELVSDCLKNKKDLEKMSLIDFIYFLTKLRKVSKGEEIQFSYKCPKCEKEGKNNFYEDVFNIDNDIEWVFKKSDLKVNLSNKIVVGLKEIPFLNLFKILKETNNTIEYNFNYILNSISWIKKDNKIFQEYELTEDFLKEFLENLSISDFNLIFETLENNLSSYKIKKISKCPICGSENKIEGFEDIISFFVL